MQPRRLSYPSLQAILPRIPFGKRMKLAMLSKLVRCIHKKAPIDLKTVRFYQPYGVFPSLNGYPEQVFSGILEVEEVKYVFTFDENTDEVSIECSLRPSKKMVTKDKLIALNYFYYFLSHPIGHLELKHCGYAFQRYQKPILCKSMKWDFGEGYVWRWMNLLDPRNFFRRRHPNNLPFPHFDRIEVHIADCNWLLITDTVMRLADNLVLHVGRFDDVDGEAEEVRMLYLVPVRRYYDIVLQSTHYFTSNEAFLNGCKPFLNSLLREGSFLKGIFNYSPSRKQRLWKAVLKKFDNAKRTVLNERECIVIGTVGSMVTAIFYDFDFDEEVFTVLKTFRRRARRNSSVVAANGSIEPPKRASSCVSLTP